MGAGVTAASYLIPLALSAAGAGAGYIAQNQAEKNRDRALAAGIRQQAQTQRRADERVDETIDDVSKSAPEKERQAAAAQFMAQLQRNRAATAGALPAVVGADERYTADAAAEGAASAETAARVAELMSRIEAPALQRQRETQRFGVLASDLGQLSRRSAGQDFIAQLRARSIRANPWLSLAGGTLQGAGYASSVGALGTPGAYGGIGAGGGVIPNGTVRVA